MSLWKILLILVLALATEMSLGALFARGIWYWQALAVTSLYIVVSTAVYSWPRALRFDRAYWVMSGIALTASALGSLGGFLAISIVLCGQVWLVIKEAT